MKQKYEMFKETLNLNTMGVKMEQNVYQYDPETKRFKIIVRFFYG